MKRRQKRKLKNNLFQIPCFVCKSYFLDQDSVIPLTCWMLPLHWRMCYCDFTWGLQPVSISFPTIENCPLIYDQWLECVTSTGSIMMPIWVLLKMVYVLFLSPHNVPKGAAQMTLWTLCRISEFSHN